MSPESQRIAIAEACGCRELTNVRYMSRLFANGEKEAFEPELPDYLNDLNAMHEAEKVLTDEQWTTYNAYIAIQSGWRFAKSRNRLDYYTTHAAAEHKAEAYLRAIDKWEPEKLSKS